VNPDLYISTYLMLTLCIQLSEEKEIVTIFFSITCVRYNDDTHIATI